MKRISCQSTESLDLERAEQALAKTALWVESIMNRLAPFLPEREPLRVLDVGCAQGRAVIALAQRGYEAYGIEPWEYARNVAMELARRVNTEVSIYEGRAESIPFDEGFFDVVLAMSVMEHVQDLDLSLREIYRVLRPGGLFWFNSASSLCPIQQEIKGFPLFGWYPDPLKQRIMSWARDHRPALVGHTETPAMHWWTPWKANRKLRTAGFSEVWDRWDLQNTKQLRGLKKWAICTCRHLRILRLLGDMMVPGCSFLARK